MGITEPTRHVALQPPKLTATPMTRYYRPANVPRCRYMDLSYEYRHVILPEKISLQVPKNRLLTETEWRNLVSAAHPPLKLRAVPRCARKWLCGAACTGAMYPTTCQAHTHAHQKSPAPAFFKNDFGFFFQSHPHRKVVLNSIVLPSSHSFALCHPSLYHISALSAVLSAKFDVSKN